MNDLLTPYEAQSAVWQKLKAYMEDELNKLRQKNDGNQNEVETAWLRGRIAQLKLLVALDNPAPPQASDEQ